MSAGWNMFCAWYFCEISEIRNKLYEDQGADDSRLKKKALKSDFYSKVTVQKSTKNLACQLCLNKNFLCSKIFTVPFE